MSAMQAFYEQISANDSSSPLTALSRASRTQIMDATRDSTWMLWDVSQD